MPFPPGWLSSPSLVSSLRRNLADPCTRIGVSIPAAPYPQKGSIVSGNSEKRILLIDLDDARRATRIRMLTAVGYQVEVRDDEVEAELRHGETTFDLVILSLHKRHLDDAAAYSERLRKKNPRLPILLMLDTGVFAPRGTLSQSFETGVPIEMMKCVAEMLAGSTHIRELGVAA